jgi:hypothetical protein
MPQGVAEASQIFVRDAHVLTKLLSRVRETGEHEWDSMKVDDAKDAGMDRSEWKKIIPAYPSGKQEWF